MRTLVAEKRLDDAGPIEDFERCGLKGGSARLVMGRGPPLDYRWLHAVTEELASGEQARRARADDEDLTSWTAHPQSARPPSPFRLPLKVSYEL